MFLESYLKHFIAPPELNRDYIFFATKELQKGNWKGCLDSLNKMTIWKHLQYLETVNWLKIKNSKIVLGKQLEKLLNLAARINCWFYLMFWFYKLDSWEPDIESEGAIIQELFILV